MINQLRAELFSLRHGALLPMSLLAAAAAAALYTGLQHLLAAGSLDASAVNGVQGLSDVLLLSLLGPLVYGVISSRPFETRTVHAALLASGRGAVVTALTVVSALLATALSLPYAAAVLIGRATGADFSAALPVGSAALLGHEGELSAGLVVGATLTDGLLTAATMAVCLPLAIRLRRPLVVMAIGFVWGFLADLLAAQAAEVERLGDLLGLTPFSPEHHPGPASTGGELLASCAVSVVFVAAMGLLSWLLLRRSDVP